MKVAVSAWKKICQMAARKFPIRVQAMEYPAPEATRPWMLSSAINERGVFGLRIRPGMVAGVPAYVDLMYREAPELTVLRIEDEVRSGKLRSKPKPTDLVQSFLHELPFIKPQWRQIDPNDPGRVLPPGVRTGSNLFSTDVIVTTRRTASTTVVDFSVSDVGQTAEVNVKYQYFEPRGFELSCVPEFFPRKFELDPRDIFFNRFSDTPVHEVKISTLYAAGPQGGSPVPDAGYQYAEEPNVFYNLAFTEKTPPAQGVFKPISFFTPLAGGLAVRPDLFANNNQVTSDSLSFINPRRTNALYHVV